MAEYRPQESKYYYYTSDQISSTRMITDDTGTVMYSATFDPFGGMQKTWVSTYDPTLKFSGKEREPSNEMDYFGARYYGHTTYRWVSPDPVIYKERAVFNSQLWNLYEYCRNNPLKYMDMDGGVDILPRLAIHYVPSSEILRLTGGQTAGGLFSPKGTHHEIQLEKIGEYWVPKISVYISIDIFIPQKGDIVYEQGKAGMNVPKSQNEALEHELSHALLGLISESKIIQDAEIIESFRTKSRLVGEFLKIGFKASVFVHSIEYLIQNQAFELFRPRLIPKSDTNREECP